MACSTCASAKWPIRHLAMTGMDTAAMIPSIMSGSLIRATPPWTRMSAGTRSSAMTATAPASSAILACSGVTTSMMTPPLSMSAMPRLTRWVPRCAPALGVPLVCSVGSTATNYLTCSLRIERIPWYGQDRVGRRGHPVSPPGTVLPACQAPGPGGPGRAGSERQVRDVRLLAVTARHQGIIDLEELGPRRAAGQPQAAGQPPAPGGLGGRDGVVVELAGQEDLVGGALQLGQELLAVVQAGQRDPEVGLAEDRPQRAGQVALGVLAARAGGPGIVRGPGQQDAGGRVEQAGGRQLQRHRAAPDQGGVQREAGRLQ